MSIREPRVLRLLERILDGKIGVIEPVLEPSSPGGFRYPVVDELLETSGDESIKILESLVEAGTLQKRFYDKIFSCPVCGSFNGVLSTQCPACGSAHIRRGRTLEHLPCAFVGLEEEFKADPGYTCPKCRKELRLLGTDYRIAGKSYKCQNCGEVFPDSVERWHCLRCSKYSPIEDAPESIVYSYQLNEAVRDRLRVELRPKRQIEEFLVKEGYEVQSPATVTGTSGVEHEIDLFAKKVSGFFEHKIVLGIVYGSPEVGQDEVLKMFAKGMDLGAQDIILIAMPKLSPIAQKLVSFYRMKVFEAKDLDRAVAQLIGKMETGKAETDIGTG